MHGPCVPVESIPTPLPTPPTPPRKRVRKSEDWLDEYLESEAILFGFENQSPPSSSLFKEKIPSPFAYPAKHFKKLGNKQR